MKTHPRILVSCGETSGDIHAANLVKEIRKKIPDAEILALGGPNVEAAGARLTHHVRDYDVLGITGVLTNLPKFARLEKELKRQLADGVDLFIPVDYPGLNMRLAAHARRLGVPVLYYISPQIWAWAGHRVNKLAKIVDYMTVILPFEEKIYRDKGVPVEFVGHPFVEDHELPMPRAQAVRSGVGLLPGSRPQEVRRILPLLLETAKWIQKERPDERFTIGRSPSISKEMYEDIVARQGVEVTLSDDAEDVMASSRLSIVASGTATLQSALLGTPLIIVYRASMLNYMIARRLVKVNHIGLVNIVLGEEACPEFIQVDAKPAPIASKALALLEDSALRETMVAKFDTLRSMLSGAGGCRRVAEISAQLIESS